MGIFSDVFKSVGKVAKGAIGILGGPAGGAISSALSFIGGERANKQNEDLSNTAMQRRVADLKAAGLNPMLAYMNPASTPQMQNTMGPAIETGVHQYSGAAAVRQQAATTANVEAQTKKLEAETKLVEAQVPYSAFSAEMNAKTLSANYTKLANEVKTALHSAEIRGMEEKQLEKLQPLMLEYQHLQNQAAKLGIPLKQAEADFFKTVPQAKWIHLIREVLGIGRR